MSSTKILITYPSHKKEKIKLENGKFASTQNLDRGQQGVVSLCFSGTEASAALS